MLRKIGREVKRRFFTKPNVLETPLDAVRVNPGLWRRARERANGPKVLIATLVTGFHHCSMLESALAMALTLRGARVHHLQCDGVLTACMRVERADIPDPEMIVEDKARAILCTGCQNTGERYFGGLELPRQRLGAHLTDADYADAQRIARETPLAEIPRLMVDGLAVGEHAHAGALRYFARGDLSGLAAGEGVLRRYLESAILVTRGVRALARQEKYDVACFHHGIYVPQGLVGEALRAEGVRIVNWNPAYRRNTFIFSHGDSYHHTMLDEPVDAWTGIPWNDKHEARIMDYLKSRWQGTRDWIWFHEKPDEDFVTHAQSMGLDLSKPVIGMLSNVMWDAQLHFRANAFSNMLEWGVETIRYFAGRPDLQLLLRIHPAEIRGTTPSQQPLAAELRKAFPEMPPNVFIIDAESPVSTYAAMAVCNAVLIFGTKTGIELTSMGVPVIVGGEAWIRNKGLTMDAESADAYFRLLDQLPLAGRMSVEQTRQARRYAYHFFFRRMVPLPFMVPGKKRAYEIMLKGLEDLGPGRFPGLDVVCDGVLSGAPFIYPAERLGLHDTV